MKCTSCRQGTLSPSYLDLGLPCHTCDHCGGNFVHLEAYLTWLDSKPAIEDVAQPDVIDVQAEDSSKALLCPQTGSIMLKYKISQQSEHRLDLSPTINAIWLDKGEWELIKAKGLATQLNAVFTDTWQRKIREAKTEDVLRALYAEKFGAAYPAIQNFRELISDMPNKAEVVAYLIADEPYKT